MSDYFTVSEYGYQIACLRDELREAREHVAQLENDLRELEYQRMCAMAAAAVSTSLK